MNIEELLSQTNFNFYNISLILGNIALLTYITKLSKKENEADKRYKICKEYAPKNISKVMIPPEIKIDINKQNIDRFIEKKYYDTLKLFITKLEKTHSKDDLSFLYKNLETLKINFLKLFIKKTKYGNYNSKTNEINIFKNEFEITLIHELFHMASSIKTDYGTFSGFSQSHFDKETKETYSFGKGLNEGYTELLTYRYSKMNRLEKTYNEFFDIARKIECIVGQNEMEKLYLKADLKELIDVLSKYSSVDEVMEFISCVDFLFNHKKDKNTYGLVNDAEKKIDTFLEKIQNNKEQNNNKRL